MSFEIIIINLSRIEKNKAALEYIKDNPTKLGKLITCNQPLFNATLEQLNKSSSNKRKHEAQTMAKEPYPKTQRTFIQKEVKRSADKVARKR